jgi:hypothetical protein
MLDDVTVTDTPISISSPGFWVVDGRINSPKHFSFYVQILAVPIVPVRMALRQYILLRG